MPYTYSCTRCGATAHTTRAADLRNRSGRRCESCKDKQTAVSVDDVGPRVPGTGDQHPPAEAPPTGSHIGLKPDIH